MPKLSSKPEADHELSAIFAVPRPLTSQEVEQVGGGRMKLPNALPVTVFYDDGITLITSNPTLNTN
jgi:hypothetical protein